MAARGSYAKGVAKRQEILSRALEVIAREGYAGTSVKRLAEAVGLSQAGLLHYFGTKEELFAEILDARDQQDVAAYGLEEGPDVPEIRDAFVRVVRHNAEVPGFVELFARLSVDAADPAHAAHRFFLERGVRLRQMFSDALARRQAEGGITDRIDPTTLARVLQAVADGLQIQWMLDPDVDMAGTIDALFEALEAPRDSSAD